MDLEANPQYYDYLHRIIYNGENSKLSDGGGQCIRLSVLGSITNPSTGILRFSFPDIDNPTRQVEFDVVYHTEEGRWVFPQYGARDFLICTKRYVFQEDPIKLYYRKCFEEEDTEITTKEEWIRTQEEEEEWIDSQKSERIYYDTSTYIYTTKDKLSEEDLQLLDQGEKKKLA